MSWQERITLDPEVLVGKPVVNPRRRRPPRGGPDGGRDTRRLPRPDRRGHPRVPGLRERFAQGGEDTHCRGTQAFQGPARCHRDRSGRLALRAGARLQGGVGRSRRVIPA